MKRATNIIKKMRTTFYISIHALVKRATRLNNVIGGKCYISIHALVKRATFYET